MSSILSTNIDETRNIISEWKKEGYSVGFVPTMGALHEGHKSLIQKATEKCDKVVVSIFVNPIQFGPNEDYDKYPRTLDADKHICDENKVDLIFAPTASEMYGESIKNSKGISNNNFTFVYPPYDFVDTLCGKSRTGHFDGVATVVLKLFNIVAPNYAFFGQKDAQQLIIIEKMVRDLNIPIEIIPCPIIRDKDGLALSSRNKYLSQEARVKALTISKSLKQIQELFNKGINDPKILLDSSISTLDKNIELEYLEFVDLNSLEKIDIINKKTLVAIAAKVDNVRLIDNIIIGEDR